MLIIFKKTAVCICRGHRRQTTGTTTATIHTERLQQHIMAEFELEQYELAELLAFEPFSVRRGLHTSSGRSVVIKSIIPDETLDNVSLLEAVFADAHSLLRLKHTCLVPVRDVRH